MLFLYALKPASIGDKHMPTLPIISTGLQPHRGKFIRAVPSISFLIVRLELDCIPLLLVTPDEHALFYQDFENWVLIPH